MAWVRIESSVARHKKFQQAGPAASWLWLCGLLYCQEGLTDGVIPRESLRYLGVHRALMLSRRLVAAGLWEKQNAGWFVHDYLDFQQDAESVRRLQEVRRKAGKLGGRPSTLGKATVEAKQIAFAPEKQSAKANSFSHEKQSAKQTENPPHQSHQSDKKEIDTSPGSAVRFPDPVEISDTDEPDPVQVARAELATAPAADGNFRVIARMARAVLESAGKALELDALVEAVKGACARAAIDYGRAPEVDADVVHRACEVERFKFLHPGIGRGAVAT